MSSFTSRIRRLRASAALTSVLVLALEVTSAAMALQTDQLHPGDVLVGGKAGAPVLVFASDRPTKELAASLSQAGVISDLKSLRAGIAIALPDLSAERADIVKQLNEAGIPVTAWLTLPAEQGYYLNAGNAGEARARFEAFEAWSAASGLRWAAIGLDIEPNIGDFAVLRSSKWHVAATLLRRYFEPGRVRSGRESYAELIKEIQSRGYPVETYQFPFIADERKMHSTLLERLGGIVDVRGDREVLMLYTSFNPAIDSALIWVYGPDAQTIAVGSTLGSESDRHFTPLTWQEFSRDLIVAHHFTNVIGVYSLEGCLRQGFFPRLKTMNWNQPVVMAAESVRKARQFRARIQRAIWIASHLPYFIVVLLVCVVALVVIWRRRRRRLATVIPMPASS